MAATFPSSQASRNSGIDLQAVRTLALAAAMEQRAQLRVNQGIADADEQIKWLDKVAGAEARLKLVSQCRDESADTVNAYLSEISQLPAKSRP